MGADINVRAKKDNTIQMQWIKMTDRHSEERITQEQFRIDPMRYCVIIKA